MLCQIGCLDKAPARQQRAEHLAAQRPLTCYNAGRQRVSRHCVSANHQQGSELKLERLTICMVSDEEMANVLSQPGYSHLNGSTHQLYPTKTTYFLERAFAYERPREPPLRKLDHRHHRCKAYDLYAIASASRPFVEI